MSPERLIVLIILIVVMLVVLAWGCGELAEEDAEAAALLFAPTLRGVRGRLGAPGLPRT